MKIIDNLTPVKPPAVPADPEQAAFELLNRLSREFCGFEVFKWHPDKGLFGHIRLISHGNDDADKFRALLVLAVPGLWFGFYESVYLGMSDLTWLPVYNRLLEIGDLRNVTVTLSR